MIEETNDFETIKFPTLLAEHLAEGWVAVMREIGFEKMRYLVGFTVAVDHTGNVIFHCLDDIYDKVGKKWGDKIKMTRCEY